MNSNASSDCSVQSRRRFLSNCSRASLAVALAPFLLSKAQAATPWLETAKRAGANLTYGKFVNQLYSVFRTSPVNLILVEATNLLHTTSDSPLLDNRVPGDEMFSLTFIGPVHPVLPQGTYTFAHKKMGTFQMFIVPGTFTGGTSYHASFNRISSDIQLA